MPKVSNKPISMKRLGVDKTNARIMATTAVAAFIVVFCLVASFSLFGTLRYQSRVIKEKKVAVKQLQSNISARDKLVEAYTAFATAPQNFIGGSSTGTAARDGSNPKLVLDALPSKYDFPALAASLEKLSLEQKLRIDNITGVDEQATHEGPAKDASAQPLPFSMKVTADYAAMQRMVASLDYSIRPIQIQSLKITGDAKEISLDVSAQTFYQPEKTFKFGTKVVK